MVKASRTARPLGVILHRGISPFDGSPYVVIMPLRKSKNSKTGTMLQTYIIRSDMHPVVAVRKGADGSICNGCPMRGVAVRKNAKKRKHRTCYVNVGQGPAMVYKAFKRGRYVDYVPALHDRFLAGRKIRFGTYGEPVLIPLDVIRHLISVTAGWTGYTHQWAMPAFSEYRQYLMASVHGQTGPWSREHAKHLGWRTFRTTRDGKPADNEILCPASEQAGKRLSCNSCNLCDGAGTRKAGLDLVDVYIPAHGGRAIMGAVNRLPVLQA